MMEERKKRVSKRVQPSKRCPRCGGWAAPETLVANNGVCIQCFPAAGFMVGVYEPKVVKCER